MGVRKTGIPVGGLLAVRALPPLVVGLRWSATLAIGAEGVLLAALLFAAFFREPAGEGEESAPPPRVPLRSIVGNRNFLAAAGALLAVLQVGGIAGRLGWGAVSDRRGGASR